jgi:hypothetical protein
MKENIIIPSTWRRLLIRVSIPVLAVVYYNGFAFERYKNPSTGSGNCSECHGAFTDATSPKGTVFPSNSKHEMHRSSTDMNTACNLCHTSGDNRNPYIGSSTGTANNLGLGCAGCHVGAGLRAHHEANGITICSDCHTPEVSVPENVRPPYYRTPDTRANNPCNDVAMSKTNENWSIGDFVGLDNDGNNLYDASDPACACSAMTVSPQGGLSSSGTVGGPFSPSSITYSLTNTGTSPINWTASKAQTWVSLSATNGTLAAGGSTNVTVSLNASANSLPPGSYSDAISLINATSGNGNTSSAVSLIVNGVGLLTLLPEGGLSSSGTAGGPFSPPSILYTLTNSGSSSLSWTASKAQNWLSLSTSSGTLASGASTTVMVSINANANSLAAGSYSETVGFTNSTTASGDTSRAVTLTVGPISTFHLTATVNNTGWGTVSPTNGTYPAGSSVQVTASPAAYYRFSTWSGDAAGTNNPVSLLLTTNASVLAVFREILTTNQPTPYWWLAAHGHTNDFEKVVVTLGANGYPLWQSYIAGLNPNDPTSQFWLAGQLALDGVTYVLSWKPVTDRLYSLWSSTNLGDGFAPMPSATNLPGTVQSFTNLIDKGSPNRFYRIEVQKP